MDTAFVFIAGQAGGPVLFFIVNLALLVAQVGSGAGSHLAAGRLLYGMGRDDAIPTPLLRRAGSVIRSSPETTSSWSGRWPSWEPSP